jgi:hypothetical protein
MWRELERRLNLDKAYIVMVSAADHNESLEGIDEKLNKPVALPELSDLIQRWVA